MQEAELMTSGHAARVLGVSPEWVRTLGERGVLTVIKTATGQRLFRGADVENLRRDRAKNPPKRGRPQKPHQTEAHRIGLPILVDGGVGERGAKLFLNRLVREHGERGLKILKAAARQKPEHPRAWILEKLGLLRSVA